MDDAQGHLRYAGFAEALHEAGLEPSDRRIIWLDTEDVKHLEQSFSKILTRMKGCTAVFCYNDEVAFFLQKLFKQNGIRVPEDISLVGIDDTELAVLGDVRLTSVPFPMEKLGETAVNNLLHMMENPKFDATYEFDVEIIERDSVKKIG
jgi:GntR family transcriptional regulator of arabinose operon